MNGIPRIVTFSLGCASVFVLADGAALAQSPCVHPPPDMEAWWPGDDCTPYDLLGQHDGTYSGAPFCPLDWKVGGGSLGFQAVPPTYITVPHAPSLNPGVGEITIDAWIKTSSIAPNLPIAEKLNFIGNGGYQFGLFNGMPAFGICDNAICVGAQAATAVNDGQWHHVAGTLVRNSAAPDIVKVHVDGQVAATTPAVLGNVASPDDLLIGAAPSNGPVTSVFIGAMDEIEIFTRALADAEIHLIYCADSFGKCKITCIADLNGDNIVDASDLALLLGSWGACP